MIFAVALVASGLVSGSNGTKVQQLLMNNSNKSAGFDEEFSLQGDFCFRSKSSPYFPIICKIKTISFFSKVSQQSKIY